MKKHNKSHNRGGILALLLEIIGILIIFVGAYVYLRLNTNVLNNVVAKNDGTKTGDVIVSGKCGLLVTSHSPNEKVDFPLTVKGIIDNTDSQSKGCTWQMFEGQGGIAQLYFKDTNGDWQKLGTSKPVIVENWTSTSTLFSVALNNNNEGVGLPAGAPLKIIFTEENASGMPPVDTFELPLIFSGTTISSGSSSANSSANSSATSSDLMSLTLYIQNKEVAKTSDCGVTQKIVYQVPKTSAVADASLKILFDGELSDYGVYKSVDISNGVAKVELESENTPLGFPISSLSSCQISQLTSVLKDTLTQYSSIKSVELYSPRGKIEF